MLKSLHDSFVRFSSFSKLKFWRKFVTLKCEWYEKLEDYFLKFDSLAREIEDHGAKIDKCDKLMSPTAVSFNRLRNSNNSIRNT